MNACGCEGLRHQRGSPARIDRTIFGHPREPTSPVVCIGIGGVRKSRRAIDPQSDRSLLRFGLRSGELPLAVMYFEKYLNLGDFDVNS